MVSKKAASGQTQEIKFSVDVIVGSLAELAGNILSFTLEILKMRRDKRARIAGYLQDVGNTIGAVATAIEKGRDVSGPCGKVRGHLYSFEGTVKPALGKKAERLNKLIDKAYRVEDLATALKPAAKKQRAKYVAQLRAISGTFLAVAKAVQASA